MYKTHFIKLTLDAASTTEQALMLPYLFYKNKQKCRNFQESLSFSNKVNVLYISAKIDVHNMHLPSEFYYFTGKCNSSAENVNQIKENFVKALSSSKFQEECVDVPECQAKYVDVTCGPVTSRRKRDLTHHLNRRSASKFAYIVQFELTLPYKAETGKSPDEIFAENEDLLYKMSNIIQQETDSGHFDLHIGDLQVESDSFGPGAPAMQCPSGTTPKTETASCGNI